MILSEARELLFEVVVPSLDSQGNVDKFNRYLNLVQERFINSGKWLGMMKEIAVISSGGYFTLPPRFVSALAVKDGTCGAPIRWPIAGMPTVTGPGSRTRILLMWPLYGYSGAIDAGDGFVTFKDSPYAIYYLRFTCGSAEDVGMQILIKGRDENGSARSLLRSIPTSYEGMTITMVTAIVTTTQKFSGRLEFLSKLRSKGYLYLDAVDTVSGGVTRIGYYAPSETIPNYHRYADGCVSEDSWVSAICKIQYTPAIADSDEVVPSNAGALRAGLAALKCEQEGDTVRRDQFLADGLRMLSDEARESRGGVRYGLRIDPAAFQFANLFQGR